MKYFIFEKWHQGTLKYRELRRTDGIMFVCNTVENEKTEAVYNYLGRVYSDRLIFTTNKLGALIEDGNGREVFVVGRDEVANLGDYTIEALSEEELQDKANINYLWSFDNE